MIDKARAEGRPGHAVYRLSAIYGSIMGVAGVIAGIAIARSATATSPTAASAIWLAFVLTIWWTYRGYTAQYRRVLGAVRGPEWNNRLHTDFVALAFGPLLGVPIAAAALVLLMQLVAAIAGRSIPAIAAALCIYPGILIWAAFGRWLIRRMSRELGNLPDAVVQQIESHLGIGSCRTMAVLRTHGAAFYNAFAVVGGSPASIWISEPLIGALPPDSIAAIAVHESAHVSRRDDLRRILTAVSLHAVLLAIAFSWFSTVSLPLSSLLFYFAFLVSITLLGQRHELAADAKAREVGLGDAMARALTFLHQINHIPRTTGSDRFQTHPLLERRLAALGFNAPEPIIGEEPIPRRLFGLPMWGWWIILFLATMCATFLVRLASRKEFWQFDSGL